MSILNDYKPARRGARGKDRKGVTLVAKSRVERAPDRDLGTNYPTDDRVPGRHVKGGRRSPRKGRREGKVRHLYQIATENGEPVLAGYSKDGEHVKRKLGASVEIDTVSGLAITRDSLFGSFDYVPDYLIIHCDKPDLTSSGIPGHKIETANRMLIETVLFGHRGRAVRLLDDGSLFYGRKYSIRHIAKAIRHARRKPTQTIMIPRDMPNARKLADMIKGCIVY